MLTPDQFIQIQTQLFYAFQPVLSWIGMALFVFGAWAVLFIIFLLVVREIAALQNL